MLPPFLARGKIKLSSAFFIINIAGARALLPAIQMRSDICKKNRAHLCASDKKGPSYCTTYICVHLTKSTKRMLHVVWWDLRLAFCTTAQAAFMSTPHTGRVGLSTNYQGNYPTQADNTRTQHHFHYLALQFLNGRKKGKNV